jgi:hypothetical protein
MAINLDKMKAKLTDIESKSGGGKLGFYKPTEGKQDVIRLLPAADGDPFVQKWMHYNVGKESFECPKRMFGDDCPVCGFVDKLWAEYNASNDDETRQAANNLKAKPRYYSLIMDREEEGKVFVWSYSKTVCQELLNFVLNPDYGDITDPKTGHDLRISTSKKAKAMYATTDLTPRPGKTVLLDSQDEIDTMMETAPDLLAITTSKSFDEITIALQGYFESMDVGALDSEEKVKGATNDEVNIDDMFKELQDELTND